MQERADRVSEGQTGEDFLQSLNHRHSGRSSAENYRLYSTKLSLNVIYIKLYCVGLKEELHTMKCIMRCRR